MQNIFSIPIEILQLNDFNNEILINYAKQKYNENKKYKDCSPYDLELKDLNSIVIQSAERFASNYTGNPNNKITINWPSPFLF